MMLSSLMIMAFSFSLTSCEKSAIETTIADQSYKEYSVSDVCSERLIFMREEEKLAHDVYVNLYETYNLPVFRNISKSELIHTSAIKGLLDQYGLEDPFLEGIGNFTNPDLNNLYAELMESGVQSLESALRVGATIEEVDIIDLTEAITNCEEDTVITVYTRLLNASGNHLRAFVGQLRFRGFEYTPQFLSEEVFSEIINGEHHTVGGGCDTISTTINDEEAEGLLFMREEEKLAHDVYVNLYNLWNVPVFNNISRSETQHTNQVLRLINTFNLEDPAQEEVGVFSNNHLQDLYILLMEQGSISLIDALKVGASIEEVDIIDLWERMDHTTNPAILRTYTNLEKASEAHLRAFVRILAVQGLDYEPQYITQDEFDRIMNI